MLKKSIVFILITLIIIYPVFSISLFPKEQTNIYSTFKIDKVLHNEYNVQVYLESLTTKSIDGFQITINYEDSSNTISIYNQLDSYSVQQYTFKINKLNPKSLEIRSITNYNHKLVFSSPITYTFTGKEQPIQEQQQITTTQQELQPEQPSIPQQLVNEPEYISYTSISKLDNEKNIIYFTKDHISSNRITTNQQGVIEYQANYQPYGNIYTQTGIEKFKFSGKELDSSNLYYFGARYYNSNIGRFTQVDPIFKPTESPYQYANNNPLKFVDPTGSQPSNLHMSAPADNTRVYQLEPVEIIGYTDNYLRREAIDKVDLFSFELYTERTNAHNRWPELWSTETALERYYERWGRAFEETPAAFEPATFVGLPNNPKVPLAIATVVLHPDIVKILARWTVKLKGIGKVPLLKVIQDLPDGTTVERTTHGLRVQTPALRRLFERRVIPAEKSAVTINLHRPAKEAFPSDFNWLNRADEMAKELIPE